MKNSIKQQIVAIALVAVSSLFFTNAANASLITFDDLSGSGSGSQITDYMGFTWTNFNVIDGTQSALSITGYPNAVVSGSNVAYDVLGATATFSSPTAFTLNSGYFTAAFSNEMLILVDATSAIGDQYSSFIVGTSGPTLESFDFGPITSVSFSSFGGTQFFPANNGAANIFAVDNLTINAPVPEPETYAMMLAGLGLMGFMVRRKKSV